MIDEFLYMNGYGLYVWTAFLFTLLSFTTLYIITKIQFVKETKKFVSKFGALDPKKADVAKSQAIIKEILSGKQRI